jgi:MFS family permease
VASIFIGIGVACLGDLPTGAAVAARFRERRGLALGSVYIGSNIGGSLIPVIATALAAAASWRHAFHVVGGALWIVLLPFALAVGRPPIPPSLDTRRVEPIAGFSPRRTLAERDFWLLFWVIFAFYLYRLGVNVHLVAYLSDLGYSEWAAAGGFSLTVGLGIAGKLFAGAVADRVGAKSAAVGNFVLIAAASLMLLQPRLDGAIPLFLVVHGLSTNAEDVVIPLIVGQRFGSANIGRVYGMLLLALVPGGILGPVLAGYVFDATGSYESVFGLFAACNAAAVVALIAVRSRG